VKLPYDSNYVEEAVLDGLIPLSYTHFPMSLIGFLFNLVGDPREVVHYSGGATLELVTNGNNQMTSKMHIAHIFSIMSAELMV
jgi:hypothetical protein